MYLVYEIIDITILYPIPIFAFQFCIILLLLRLLSKKIKPAEPSKNKLAPLLILLSTPQTREEVMTSVKAEIEQFLESGTTNQIFHPALHHALKKIK